MGFIEKTAVRHRRPRYESGGEAQALVRPARGRGLPLPKTCEAPSPTVGFRIIIDDLVPIPVVTLSLVVGKEIQQAKKIPMNASGGGDYRRKESLAHIRCRVGERVLGRKV